MSRSLLILFVVVLFSHPVFGDFVVGGNRPVVVRLVSDDSRADDLTQEALLAALTSPPRRQGSLRAWLGTVLRYRARSGHRSESRRKEREARAAQPEKLPSTQQVLE